MSRIKKYILNYTQAFDYFIEAIDEANALSRYIAKNFDFSLGSFFTLLPCSPDFENHAHSFKYGYTASSTPVKNYISRFIFKIISNRSDMACVFDDFLSKYHSDYKEDLFVTNGKFLNEEIYYFFTQNDVSLKKIETAFRYSDQIWHSLTVVYKAKVMQNDKKLTIQECEDICNNAAIIAVTAYDGQGCVFWERHNM